MPLGYCITRSGWKALCHLLLRDVVCLRCSSSVRLHSDCSIMQKYAQRYQRCGKAPTHTFSYPDGCRGRPQGRRRGLVEKHARQYPYSFTVPNRRTLILPLILALSTRCSCDALYHEHISTALICLDHHNTPSQHPAGVPRDA